MPGSTPSAGVRLTSAISVSGRSPSVAILAAAAAISARSNSSASSVTSSQERRQVARGDLFAQGGLERLAPAGLHIGQRGQAHRRIFWPMTRSMMRSRRISLGCTSVIALPVRPARPVRPMRWT